MKINYKMCVLILLFVKQVTYCYGENGISSYYLSADEILYNSNNETITALRKVEVVKDNIS